MYLEMSGMKRKTKNLQNHMPKYVYFIFIFLK